MSEEKIDNDTDFLMSVEMPEGENIYLNALDVMDTLIRGYANSVMEVRSRWDSGDIGQEEAIAEMKELARGLDSILMGKDPDFIVTGWNTPEQLGRYVQKHCKFNDDPANAVMGALGVFTSDLNRCVLAYTEGKQSEDDMKTNIDMLLETYTHMFLGTLSDIFDEEDYLDTFGFKPGS